MYLLTLIPLAIKWSSFFGTLIGPHHLCITEVMYEFKTQSLAIGWLEWFISYSESNILNYVFFLNIRALFRIYDFHGNQGKVNLKAQLNNIYFEVETYIFFPLSYLDRELIASIRRYVLRLLEVQPLLKHPLEFLLSSVYGAAHWTQVIKWELEQKIFHNFERIFGPNIITRTLIFPSLLASLL